MDEPKTADDVKALVAERDIRFIRFWFTDILGHLKSFSINAAELDDAFERGMGFDGSSITGFNAIEESDMVAMPDPATFATLPWRPEESGVARMFCDILTPERTPYEGDPRHVLRRALRRAESMGFDTFNVGPELEYFLFKDKTGTEVLDEGGYFDLTRSTPAPTCAARPCWRSSSSASTSSTPTTRSAPPSTRSTCAMRRR